MVNVSKTTGNEEKNRHKSRSTRLLDEKRVRSRPETRENSSNKSQSEVPQRYEDGAHRGPTEVQEATTQQPHVRWYHIQFGRTNTSSGSPQRSRRGPTEVHNGQRQPHNTSALRDTELGRTIHRREARRGPARYTEVQRFTKQPVHSTRSTTTTAMVR